VHGPSSGGRAKPELVWRWLDHSSSSSSLHQPVVQIRDQQQ
jgi:hypothetical protein